jgi:hypothetical protein
MKLYVGGVLMGILVGVTWTLHLSAPSVQAQSATWEVVAEPESVGGVGLTIVRHVSTRSCYLVAKGEGVSVQPVSPELCGDPSMWEAIGSGGRFIVGTEPDPSEVPSSQPSSGQTSKQPGVPN